VLRVRTQEHFAYLRTKSTTAAVTLTWFDGSSGHTREGGIYLEMEHPLGRLVSVVRAKRRGAPRV